MTERTVARLTTALWVSAAIIGVAGTVLTVVAWPDLKSQDSFPNLVSAFAGIGYAVLGALIVRRARNLVGWILLGVGLGLTILSFTSAYAVAGALTHPGALPAPKIVGATSQPVFAGTAIGLGYLLFVFPSGALPSPRWRPIVRLGLVAGALTVLGFLFVVAEEHLTAPGGVSLQYPNPLRIDGGNVLSTALVAAVWVVSLVTAAAFLSLVIRYRTEGSEQRQQIKWIAFAAASIIFLNLAALVSLFACHCDSSLVATLLLQLEGLVVLIGVPAALAIAILKHGLYDIDVIINRAVVYGVLAAGFTAVYVGLVVGVGTLVGRRGSPGLTIVAAVAIALLFQPLRLRAQRFANRVVYGERATPYQVLSEFADRMAGTFGLDDVLHQMASILAAGTGARRVDVWLRIGHELRSVATWPADAAAPPPIALEVNDALPAFDGMTRVSAVRHSDELLGALAIQKPPNEPLTTTEEKLLEDLASQAGLVLRNVRLTADLRASLEDLRASRRRLVEAQDQERRKIERNLHDGAQQQLVALAVKIRLAETLAKDEDAAKTAMMLEQLQSDAGSALEDLRDLARGIYPPLLADKGLPDALTSQARKSTVPVDIDARDVGRYPQDVEAAVYFCCLEALQNIAKYAHASRASITLSQLNGSLMFDVTDDGDGFDPGSTGYGTGLQGMADRLDALGGSLEVRSVLGEGTAVTGRVPAA